MGSRLQGVCSVEFEIVTVSLGKVYVVDKLCVISGASVIIVTAVLTVDGVP